MSDSRRLWSEDEIAQLKSMAGRFPAKEIAAELGRSSGAIFVEASRLNIPLTKRSGVPRANRVRTFGVKRLDDDELAVLLPRIS